MSIKDKLMPYEEAKRRSLLAAITVRVLGVPLQAKTSDGYIPIWWCGIGFDGAEHRETTHRIWHLPQADIMGSGKTEGFSFEGCQVHWYDVKRDCSPMEESFSPVSLVHSARLYLGRRFGLREWLFDGDILGDVPVTLDPTAGPTGTKPPTTLNP